MSNPTSPMTISFMLDWVQARPCKSTYSSFNHYPLNEIDGSRDTIKDKLVEVVYQHHIDPEYQSLLLEQLAAPIVAAKIRSHFPVEWTTKIGNFGEVLGSEYIRQVLGYEVPVFRLRFNSNHDQSMKGDDAVGVILKGNTLEFMILEVKTAQNLDKRELVEAVEGLKRAKKLSQPASWEFITERMFTNKHPDAAKFSALVYNGQFSRAFLLFSAYGGAASKDPASTFKDKVDNFPRFIFVDLH
jgi:hypothetical protein